MNISILFVLSVLISIVINTQGGYVFPRPLNHASKYSSSRFKSSNPSSLVSIDNGIVKLSVDLSKGCSIVEYIDLSSNVNMINSHDLGREVQASFYAGPTPYDDCVWNGQEWSWNPIGSGNPNNS